MVTVNTVILYSCLPLSGDLEIVSFLGEFVFLFISAWISSGFSGFLQQSKSTHYNVGWLVTLNCCSRGLCVQLHLKCAVLNLNINDQKWRKIQKTFRFTLYNCYMVSCIMYGDVYRIVWQMINCSFKTVWSSFSTPEMTSGSVQLCSARAVPVLHGGKPRHWWTLVRLF